MNKRGLLVVASSCVLIGVGIGGCGSGEAPQQSAQNSAKVQEDMKQALERDKAKAVAEATQNQSSSQ